MKKVIVVCFALAIVLEAALASSVQAQLFGGRFRIRQNRNNNCCCQPANCGTQATSYDGGEVVVSSDAGSSYDGGEVSLQPTPMMSEVAPVSYEQPAAQMVGYAEPVSSDCGCGGSVGQVSYEAPVQPMTVAPATDCGGCCDGCGQVSYEGAVQGEVMQGQVMQGGYVEGAVQGSDVIYQGEPTLATQGATGETIVSEEVIKEEVISADTTIESPASESTAPASAPASEDSVPDAPKTDA